MKKLILIVLIAAVTFSCQKEKEAKEWKKKQGIYYLDDEEYTVYQNDTLKLSFDKLHLIDGNIVSTGTRSGKSKAVNFYAKKGSEDYELKFSSLLGAEFVNEQMINPQIPKDKFVNGREFYLSFPKADEALFTVVENGEIVTLKFEKR